MSNLDNFTRNFLLLEATLDLGTNGSNLAATKIAAYYCIFHETATAGVLGNTVGNITYTGAADGSNNTLFSGGYLGKITDGTGTEIGTADVFQPFLVSSSGSNLATLKTGSFALQSANRGCVSAFSANNGDPFIGYKNMTTNTWVDLRKTGTSSFQVTADQLATTRNATPAVGSVESPVDNVFMVKALKVTGGTVNGATLYGDVYSSGTNISITEIPTSGYSFTQWNDQAANQYSTANPLNLTVTSNVILVPVFTSAAGGTYTISYAGNDNTSGTAPTASVQSAPAVISSKNTLQKKGFRFAGWNTQPNGSGTDYADGATYSTGTNLKLYAKWIRNYWTGSTSSASGTTSNWEAAALPASDEIIVFSPAASNDLVLSTNATVASVDFNGSGKKLDAGNYTLTLSEAPSGSASGYIKTNGTGRLKLSVPTGQTISYAVGNTAYNPVSITNNTGSTDDFSVTVLDNVYETGSGGTVQAGAVIRRTWDITKTSANSGSGVSFTFNWNAGEESQTINAPALFHYGNGEWTKQTSGTTSSTSTSLTYTGYTGGFSPFSVMESNITLPVNWVSFTAEKQQQQVKLKWSTASETGSDKYIIQHGRNGLNWTTIGAQKAAGNSSSLLEYSFSHTHPVEGPNYYRLLQKDLDGKESYSKIVSVSVDKAPVAIFPNPVSGGKLFVELATPETARLYDVSGVLHVQQAMNAGLNTMNIAGLPKGNYLLKMSSSFTILIQ